MLYSVCAVFDVGIGAFGRPFFTRAKGEAIRSFQDEVNRDAADNPLNRHPKDFRLFELASFDDQTGRFLMPDSPELLLEASAARVKVE